MQGARDTLNKIANKIDLEISDLRSQFARLDVGTPASEYFRGKIEGLKFARARIAKEYHAA